MKEHLPTNQNPEFNRYKCETKPSSGPKIFQSSSTELKWQGDIYSGIQTFVQGHLLNKGSVERADSEAKLHIYTFSPLTHQNEAEISL